MGNPSDGKGLRELKVIKLLQNLFVLKTGLNFCIFLRLRVHVLRAGRSLWSLFCSFSKTSLNSLSTSSWRQSKSLVRPDLTKASLYEQKGKIMHIALFCTHSSSLERYTSWKTGHAYSVIRRIQVQKNWTSPRGPRPEGLSWDKPYKRFLALLIMKSLLLLMCQNH